jgi:type II secretory pathway component GspD/PulD (secretin)
MNKSNRPGGRCQRLGLAALGLAATVCLWGAALSPSRARTLQGEGEAPGPIEVGLESPGLPILPDPPANDPGPEVDGFPLPDLGDLDSPPPAIALPDALVELSPDAGQVANEDGVTVRFVAGPVPSPEPEPVSILPPPAEPTQGFQDLGLDPTPAPAQGLAAPVPPATPVMVPGPDEVLEVLPQVPVDPTQLMPGLGSTLPDPLGLESGVDLGPEVTPPPVNLRVIDEDLEAVFQMLTGDSGVSIFASPAVSGQVTIELEDVPFEQALNILLRQNKLAARREGNLIFVYTLEEALELERQQRQQVVRVYHLNYIQAAEVIQIIAGFKSPEGVIVGTPISAQGITGAGSAGSFGGTTGGIVGGGMGGVSGGMGGGLAGGGLSAGEGGGGGLSGGGFTAAGSPVAGGAGGGNSYAVHDMVVVRDYPEVIQVIDEIVSRLDVQPMQVLIEAVIISVELRDGQQLGVNFAVVDKLATDAIVSGSGAAINLAGGFSPAQVLSAAGPATAPAPLGPYMGDRPGQLLPGYLADQGLKYGFVSNSVAGFIRALETLNKINILASPRLLVLNKQLAEIQLGQRLGYATTFTNLTTASEQVQFIPVGTLLALRPFVSQDGMIRLEVHPERSSGFIDSAGIPQLNTSELTTNIMVPDGATIVIGGLIDSTDEITEEGVLGLSRLPFIGPLFRTRTMGMRKQELLVLLTPRIINRGGLPAPRAGVPPKGPSGVPNSGPMPGPSLFADAELGMPEIAPVMLDPGQLTRRSPRETLSASSGLRDLLFTDFGAIGASSTAEMLGASRSAPRIPAGSPTPPPSPSSADPDADPGVQPVSYMPPRPTAMRVSDAPNATRAAFASPSPSPSPSPYPAQAAAMASAPAQATTPREERGYRPGDLTRAFLSRVSDRLTPDEPRPSAMPARVTPGAVAPPAMAASPAPAQAPRRDPAVAPVGMAQHVVRQGEDFRTIAGQYYGSPSLHAALWVVNRHTASSPEAIQPGMTVLLPPTEVLERVYVDAVQATVRAQSPEASAPPRPSPDRKRFGLFGGAGNRP